MKWILALGLICSIASCFASGTEQKELGDAREPELVSSLLPDSQDSTYFLAFPVDDVNNNNDQPEEVKAAGGMETEKPPSAEDNKEEIMTVVVNDDDDKLSKDDVIPLQSIMPKEDQKITIPPSLPFFLRPKPERPPFSFQSPFERFPFRPKFLPPVRNLLKSFRREESPMKLSPMDIVGAASFLRRMLSTRLRTFAERHQYPIVEEKVSSMPLPLFLPREPLPLPPPPPPPPPPQSIFLPIRTPEPMFRSPFSPLHSLLLPPHPFSFHPSILLPPFALPFSIPPTHFLPSPFYHPLPPFYQPPMPPFYHAMPPPPPFYHPLPPPPPPPFMQSIPVHDPMTVQNKFSPIMQEPHGDSIKMIPSEPKEDENENFVIIPSEEDHLPLAKSDEYVLLYPNQADFSQNDISIPPPRTRKSLFDFLPPPRSNNIRRVIQQTRIFTQFKPESFLYNQPEQSVYHKPIFRIFDN